MPALRLERLGIIEVRVDCRAAPRLPFKLAVFVLVDMAVAPPAPRDAYDDYLRYCY